jgi:radical SAM family uncharacterized protein
MHSPQEKGVVLKTWRGRLRFCLVYPNRYFTGMGSLGFQWIYRIINDQPDCLCERAFLPEEYESYSPIFERGSYPLRSIESRRPLGDFDVIAFSISFENDYINCLRILDLSGIPLMSKDRKDPFPLIIAGGITSFLNPEPMSDFIDLFVIGEGEEVIPEFIERLRKFKGSGLERQHLIEKFADIEGIYAPELFKFSYEDDGRIREWNPPIRINRRVLKEIDSYCPTSTIFSDEVSFGDMFLVEVSRGCSRGCRFCAAGYVYRPPRYRDIKILRDMAKKGLAFRDKIGLIGPSVCDHPYIEELCRSIIDESGKISIASLRLDSLTEDLIWALSSSGHKTISIAPECASQRLRRMLKKEFSEKQIEMAVKLAVENGIMNIRLYFMVGLPTETIDDVREIVSLTKRIKHHFLMTSRSKGRIGRITLSISPFVPKPATPFQWAPMDGINSLKNKIGIIKSGLDREPNIRVVHELPKWSYIQALLSRGDRRIGLILLTAHRFNGDWKRALREVQINPDFYVYRQRDMDERFPWDFIDHGFSKDLLLSEYKRAMEDATDK